MARITILLSFLFLLSCSNSAKKSVHVKNCEMLSQTTSIEFSEINHNFGSLQAGEIVLYTFEFTNTGEHDYRINKVESDCGCVSVRFTENNVKPGQKGWIEVELDTSGLVGREYKTIEVHGNSAELKHLAIFAEVKNELLEIK